MCAVCFELLYQNGLAVPCTDFYCYCSWQFRSKYKTSVVCLCVRLSLLCAFFNIWKPIAEWSKKHQVRPRTGHEGSKWEYMYSAAISLTSALDGDGWLTPHPGRFNPREETQCPLYRRLGGPQSRSGRARGISPPPGFDSRTVQSVASRYMTT